MQQGWTGQVCWQEHGATCLPDILQSQAVLSSYLTQDLFLLLLFPRSTHPFKDFRYPAIYIDLNAQCLDVNINVGLQKACARVFEEPEKSIWSIKRSWVQCTL